MTQAIVKQFRFGKNKAANRLYARIKNGNIYRLNAPILIEHNARKDIVEQINAARKINLKHWTQVSKRPRLTRDEYIAEHGSLPEDKSYSVVDADGYPVDWSKLLGEAS